MNKMYTKLFLQLLAAILIVVTPTYTLQDHVAKDNARDVTAEDVQLSEEEPQKEASSQEWYETKTAKVVVVAAMGAVALYIIAVRMNKISSLMTLLASYCTSSVTKAVCTSSVTKAVQTPQHNSTDAMNNTQDKSSIVFPKKPDFVSEQQKPLNADTKQNLPVQIDVPKIDANVVNADGVSDVQAGASVLQKSNVDEEINKDSHANDRGDTSSVDGGTSDVRDDIDQPVEQNLPPVSDLAKPQGSSDEVAEKPWLVSKAEALRDATRDRLYEIFNDRSDGVRMR